MKFMNKRGLYTLLSLVSLSSFFIVFQNFTSQDQVIPNECSDKKKAEILAEPTAKSWAAKLDCNLKLSSSDEVKKTIIISGAVKNIGLHCNHNKTLNTRTKLTRVPGLTELILIDKTPAMSADEIASLHKEKKVVKNSYLYATPAEIQALIENDKANLEHLENESNLQKKRRVFNLESYREIQSTMAKIGIKLTLLRAHYKAFKRKDYSLYPKFLAVMSMDTKWPGGKESRSDYLIRVSRENKYITEDLEVKMGKLKAQSSHRILVISSLNKEAGGVWERPENITIRNCDVQGPIRVLGMSPNGEDRWTLGKYFTRSSRNPDHTIKAQNAAPTNINLLRLIVRGKIYFSPGVTKSRIDSSQLINAPIYLDAESADNLVFRNSFISTEPESEGEEAREYISVDGSSRNLIARNTFGSAEYPLNRGGVYLYRNCGENGVSRHQISNNNIIRNNKFVYELGNTNSDPAVYINYRYGKKQYYCSFDNKNKYGSGDKDNNELVEGSKVMNNTVVNWNDRNGPPLKFLNVGSSRLDPMLRE